MLHWPKYLLIRLCIGIGGQQEIGEPAGAVFDGMPGIAWMKLSDPLPIVRMQAMGPLTPIDIWPAHTVARQPGLAQAIARLCIGFIVVLLGCGAT